MVVSALANCSAVSERLLLAGTRLPVRTRYLSSRSLRCASSGATTLTHLSRPRVSMNTTAPLTSTSVASSSSSFTTSSSPAEAPSLLRFAAGSSGLLG